MRIKAFFKKENHRLMGAENIEQEEIVEIM